MADPSLTLAAAADWFGWAWDDWDRLAGGTIAGHLIECGTQVTGGIATDWLQTPEVDHIGFPIVDINADGSCVVTKPRGSGGRVCRQTVKEQLVYEIGDPDAYLSPDVTVSMLSVQIDDDGNDRIRVRGARGRPAPTAYKVSATYPDGFWAEGRLTIFGSDAVPKARRRAGPSFCGFNPEASRLRKRGRMPWRRGLSPPGHGSGPCVATAQDGSADRRGRFIARGHRAVRPRVDAAGHGRPARNDRLCRRPACAFIRSSVSGPV